MFESKVSANNAPAQTIISMLMHHSQTNPNKPAYRLLSKDKELQSVTYGELVFRVLSLAYQMQNQVKPTDRVILCAQGFVS